MVRMVAQTREAPVDRHAAQRGAATWVPLVLLVLAVGFLVVLATILLLMGGAEEADPGAQRSVTAGAAAGPGPGNADPPPIEDSSRVAREDTREAVAPEADPTDASLTLRFVDERTGEAVPDIYFVVFRESPYTQFLRAGRADPEGRAAVGDLPRGTLLVETERTGAFPPTLAAAWNEGGSPTEVLVRLTPGGMVHGRVVDDRGVPLPDLPVTVAVQAGLRGFPDERPDGDSRRDLVVRTDQEGRYRLEPVASRPRGVWVVDGAPRPERWEEVRVGVSDGFQSAWQAGHVTPGGERELPDLVLPRPGVLEGHLRFADGRPAAAALLSADPRRQELGADAELLGEAECRTGQDGSFRLRNLAHRESARVWTPEQGHQSVLLPGAPPGGIRSDVELLLPVRHNIFLELFVEGVPVEAGTFSLMVWARGGPFQLTQGVVSTEAGDPRRRVQLEVPLEGLEFLQVQGSGFEPVRLDGPFVEGETRRVFLERRPRHVLRFRLVPPGGEPPPAGDLPYVSIRACMASPELRRRRGAPRATCCGFGDTTRLDPSITATQELRVRLPEPYWLTLIGPAPQGTEVTVGPFPPGDEVRDIPLPPWSELIPPEAAPEDPAKPTPPDDAVVPARFQLRLHRRGDGADLLASEVRVRCQPASGGTPQSRFLTPSPPGSVLDLDLPPGTWSVQVRADGHAWSEPAALRFVAGQTGRHDFFLEALEPVFLEGVLLQADGQPAAGLAARFLSAGNQHDLTLPEDGRFRLALDPPGDEGWSLRVEVRATSPLFEQRVEGIQLLALEGVMPGQEAVLELRPWVSLELCVRGVPDHAWGRAFSFSLRATREGVGLLGFHPIFDTEAADTQRHYLARATYTLQSRGLLYHLPEQTLDLRQAPTDRVVVREFTVQ